MTAWDHSADFISVGSGGGGLVAALTAREAGLDALVLEKRDLVGGSTAMSGGVIWLPNNPLMQAEGVPDSEEAGLQYLEAVVGDVGPASSKERRRAYLRGGAEMIRFLQQAGVQLIRCPGYSDYYPNHPGGVAAGRSIEGVPFDGKRLGEWLPRLQPGMAKGYGLPLKTNEARAVQYYNRTLRCFVATARVWLRLQVSRLRRQDLLTNGASLVGQTLRIALDRGVDVWTGTQVRNLVVEDGRVVGLEVEQDGRAMRLQARRGVLISAGGFGHSSEMRAKHSGDQPNNAEWSLSNPGDTGEAIEAAMALGAQTDLMDEAWWIPSPAAELRQRGSTLSLARQRAGAILVDSSGRRFCNESESYMEVGKEMYARDKTARAVPCWLVFDDGYRRRYVHYKSVPIPGRMPKEWLQSGALKRANSLDELAKLCDIDPTGLAETVRSFNEHAAKGEEPEFGRGSTAYNDAMGDPGRVPNPCLAPLDRAPFYATEIYPADVGTCGGLVCDEFGRVLAQDNQPIPGLYATGNSTATINGRVYPGAGASIGYSMTFGYLSAQHAASQNDASAKAA